MLNLQRYPTDKAYYIAKEILMTERTYRKDLELLNKWFREEVNKEDNMPDDLLELLFSLLEPIYDFHCTFLKEIEQRLSIWEGKTNAHLKGDYQRIGDIMMQNMPMLEPYKEYLDSQLDILDKLNQCYQKNKKFEQVYKEFEMQKMCYLPFNTFILKPAQRLMHYKLMLERLIKHYGPDHLDYIECKASLNKLKDVASAVANSLRKSENYVKLVELQRDIVGIDNLVQPRRTFIREGCLQKLSKKGFQQRMFFLFSDVLLYANRTATPILQFKIHGQLPLRGVIVEDCEPKMGAPNCFTIYSNNRAIIVSAGTREEKDKWLEDLTEAIQTISRELKSDKFSYTSLRSCSSSDEVLDKSDVRLEEEIQSPTRPVEKSAQQRSNTTVHVCWHRNTSVSMKDHVLAIENQLSGYLLRKFKNSNGWQKLWVVFTNFCLFFYKTFEDNFPLASLPLLGYTVGSPSEKDNIAKDYVFKLQFKNHIYFFRAESEYTFGRWMEVIVSATQHSGRFRLFSRKESTNDN